MNWSNLWRPIARVNWATVWPRTRNFIGWIIPTLIIPTFPLAFEFLVMRAYDIPYLFPNQRVLTVALILPLVALKEAKDNDVKFGLVGISLLGLTLFVISIFAETIARHAGAARLTYNLGLGQMVFMALLMAVLKIVRLCKGIEE